MALQRIAFLASTSEAAQAALVYLTARYGQCPPAGAEVIVALGGDGFMLTTLHDSQALDVPVYGMNCGTIGFLMNAYGDDDLPARLAAAHLVLALQLPVPLAALNPAASLSLTS